MFTGDPGPRPEPLAAQLQLPIQLIWGAEDAWTPVDGTVARAFKALAAERPQQVQWATVPRCGHVPFDDRPQEVVGIMLPFLRRVGAGQPAPAA